MKHPKDNIDENTAAILKGFTKEAEDKGRLCEEQLDIIYKNKWFNLFVPSEYDGLELSLTEGLYIEEALAYLDGSLGWTVTLCAGANWFIGFLDTDAASEIFSDKQVCLAGSGRPSGAAKILPDGYELSGYWRYATGAPHATIFTANCELEQDGKILKDTTGNAQIASFWFKKEEVSIEYNWKTMGMKATASESFSVNKIIIPPNRVFLIEPSKVVLPHSIYRYPFLQFAEATLAVNLSGMAMRFFDLCEPLLNEKNTWMDAKASAQLKKKFKECSKKLKGCRGSFYNIIEESWAELTQLNTIDEAKLKLISAVCRNLAVSSKMLVEELYPYCGLTAADPSTEINRVWRDIHTASQHPLVNVV